MGHYFVKIRTTTWERLRDLQQVYDLDVFRQTARQPAEGVFEIQGLLSDAQIQRVRADGYEVEVAAAAEQVARKRLQDIRRGPTPPADPCSPHSM